MAKLSAINAAALKLLAHGCPPDQISDRAIASLQRSGMIDVDSKVTNRGRAALEPEPEQLELPLET